MEDLKPRNYQENSNHVIGNDDWDTFNVDDKSFKSLDNS